MQSKFLYLEQQIEEVNQALDMEWKEHVRNSNGKVSNLRVFFFNYSESDGLFVFRVGADA